MGAVGGTGGIGGTLRRCGPAAALALALALAGCRGGGAPQEPQAAPIAKVGAEKITEAQFREMVRAYLKDQPKDQVDEFLDSEERRGQRSELLSNYIDGRRMVMLAKDEGLDGDAEVKLMLEEAATQVYAQALLQRRVGDREPTDEQLRALYGELAAAQRAKGAGIPPFEEARQFLPQFWKQKRQSEAEKALLEEGREKYPATFADAYRPLGGGQ